MITRKLCPDCGTYKEPRDGDVAYCPYCGSKIKKDKFMSDSYIISSDLDKALKKAKKHRF